MVEAHTGEARRVREHGAPQFSIVVPTYNQARYLPAALDSILAQSIDDWEAVVVNDGSTDETPGIVDDYAARDPRIVAVHKDNGGVATALNTGLARARGQWILWLSSDDLFEPRKLEIHARWIRTHPDCSFFFSYFRLLRESTGMVADVDLWGPLPPPDRYALGMLYRNFVSGITICAASHVFRAMGGFDERFWYAQDYDCWLRILRDYPACFIPEYTVTSRNHAEQGSEVFPQACYYDTARAAIEHINQRPFEDWFPAADLTSEATALSILDDALILCRDTTAFCYALGPHGGLLARIAEWVLRVRADSPALGDRLSQRLRDVCQEVTGEAGPHPEAWSFLESFLETGSDAFSFEPVDPLGTALGSGEVERPSSVGGPSALAQYLSRFMDVSPDGVRDLGREARVLLVDVADGDRLDEAARRLCREGARVTVLTIGEPRLRLGGGISRVQLQSELPPQRWLPLLGEYDEVAGWAPSQWAAWIRARWRFELFAPGTGATDQWPDAVVERIVQRLDPRRATGIGRTQAVFLQRVLAGGGAENVVHAIAHALDTRRFDPVVVTFVPESVTPLAYASDILVVSLAIYEGDQAPRPMSRPQIGWAPRGRLARRVLLPLLRRGEAIVWRVGRGLAYRFFKYLDRVCDVSFRCARRGRRWARGQMARIIGARSAVEERLDSVSQNFEDTRQWRERWRKLTTSLGERAVIVSVMEEAAIGAWQCPESGHPRVVSLHTMESEYLPSMYPREKLVAALWGLTSACGAARSVAFPSRASRDDFARLSRLDGGNFEVVPNPVHCARLRWLAGQSVAEALVPLIARPYLVHIARIAPEKNHRALLDAVERARSVEPSMRVLCVGEGPRRQWLEDEIVRRGLQAHVILTGHLDNPYPVLERARALVLTSDFESFGLVILEAWCCETPVVSATGKGGPIELIVDGADGISVPPGDSQALADAMVRLYREPALREDLAAAGLARVVDFDSSVVAARWSALLDRAVGVEEPAELTRITARAPAPSGSDSCAGADEYLEVEEGRPLQSVAITGDGRS